MISATLTRRFWREYSKAMSFNAQMERKFGNIWKHETIPRVIEAFLKKNKKLKKLRIGYIVATCSPVTRAHLALAQQAADDLKLSGVFFILWPFYYIKGFHNQPLDSWIKKQKHLSWKDRFNLLKLALNDIKDYRLFVLPESKKWYIESSGNYLKDEPFSAFWTGTWYVIRKFQWIIRKNTRKKLEFNFICGIDQFNPNIDSLVNFSGSEQVWQDYSIVQHLVIHNIYVVPRKLSNFHAIEEFIPPFGCEYDVIIGKSLKYENYSATKVRFKKMQDSELENYVTPSVAAKIRENGWWGYENL